MKPQGMSGAHLASAGVDGAAEPPERMFTGVGASMLRREDERFLKGSGCFTDDVSHAGSAHAAMLRSPHAHARIVSMTDEAARHSPGVLAVLTAPDAKALRPLPHRPMPTGGLDVEVFNADGSGPFASPHFPLAGPEVRFIGEVIAVVLAQTALQARDAAERISVEWEILPAVVDGLAACEPGAAPVWTQRATNVILDASLGDALAVEQIFASAPHRVSLDALIPRVTAAPLEPRAVRAHYDAARDHYTVYAGGGGAVRHKSALATVLGVEPDQVRVIAGDVGGNFGSRNPLSPEFALVAWASKLVGRPIAWTADRHESFLSDYQGRDLHVKAELAFDAEGRFLAMRESSVLNLGAYAVTIVPSIKSAELMTSVYKIPSACAHVRVVNTNLPPITNLRGAGRPEAMYVIERLIDQAAMELKMDRLEIRRKNLLGLEDGRHRNSLGIVYDEGDFASAMEVVVGLGDWAGFEDRKVDSGKRGKLRGIGISNYLEITTGDPFERAVIHVHPEGGFDVIIGTQSSGQGHETSFAQVVSQWLEVPFESVRILSGDTDIARAGGGTASSRSMRMAGIVIKGAVVDLIEKAKKAAAERLEVAQADILYEAGCCRVRGTDRAVTLFEIAMQQPGGLSGAYEEVHRVAGFPYGAAIAEVEVDPQTGFAQVVQYVAVDDVGTAVNPMIIHGQTHGGIVQGIGQALLERCIYDREGQLLSGSLMDYALPRASDVPFFGTEILELPSATNELGVRAGGEGGVVPAPAAIMNALLDALRPLGVTDLPLPATPQSIWRAMEANCPPA